jgi:ATP-binding cassette, subfamily F, member 3
VLDEPTNHLDIPARETLEDALSAYEGTLITVSHDRYFLDRICTRLLVIEGTHVEAHLGNYSDWRERSHKKVAPPQPAPAPVEVKPAEKRAADTRGADKQREREQRRLARRVETLEADVSKLEADLAAVRAELAADHAGDWSKLHALAERERELDASLTRRMAEWESATAAATLNTGDASTD